MLSLLKKEYGVVKEYYILEELEDISMEVPPSIPPSSKLATQSIAHRTSPSYMGDNNNRSSTNQSKTNMRSIREFYEQIEDGVTNFFYLYTDHKPLTFQEAVEEDCWQGTMAEEIHAIQKNKTWELITLLPNQMVISVSSGCTRSITLQEIKLNGTRLDW